MFPFFFILEILGLFRLDPTKERVGLDISHRKGSAYDIPGDETQKDIELNQTNICQSIEDQKLAEMLIESLFVVIYHEESNQKPKDCFTWTSKNSQTLHNILYAILPVTSVILFLIYWFVL